MYINNRINNTYTLKVEIRPTLDLQIFATDYYCKRNLSCFILVWRATSPSTARSTFLHSH